jgi:molybdopterin-guanine dinucleotide biosynthesis protein MobB
MRVFAVSGFSGTGKTTLVESIVKSLVSRGYSVVTVKSSQHEPTESEGTDTERHQHAGAMRSYFRGPSDRERSLGNIVNSSIADYLIVEGMKSSAIPKIWCIGNSSMRDTIPIEVKAIVSWNIEKVEDKYDIPILASNDIDQIVAIIIRESIELDRITI